MVAVGEGQIDESATINGLLVIGHTIDQSKLTCHLVAGIAEQREGQVEPFDRLALIVGVLGAESEQPRPEPLEATTA